MPLNSVGAPTHAYDMVAELRGSGRVDRWTGGGEGEMVGGRVRVQVQSSEALAGSTGWCGAGVVF